MTIADTPPMMDLRLGQAFLPLFHNQDPFVLIESPRGCLKTCSILDVLMFRAAKWPGKRWYIWRSTRSLLSTTVLPSFEEYVIPRWQGVEGMKLVNPAARPTQRSEYIFENGSVFLPVGLDDVLRGTSSEGAGGYLAEAIELPNRDTAAALVGMMRQPGVPFHQIIVDVNPGPPGHWVNSAAEPIDPTLRRVTTRADYDRLQKHNASPAKNPARVWKRIVAKIMDNPFYFDVVAWKLTEAGAMYLKSLGSLTGHLHARWVGGEWKGAEGSVYPQFDEEIHGKAPFDIPDDWPIYVVHDPGRDHPAASLWIALAPNGAYYVFDELYQRGWGVVEHAKAFKAHRYAHRITRYYGDPQHILSQTFQAPKSIQTQYAEQGIRMSPWPRTGSNEDSMVEAVRTRLIHDMPVKAPTLFVIRTCVNTIMEFQSWQYKRTSAGELPPGEDKYEDRLNHAMDCVKGAVALNLKYDPGRIEIVG